jgi:hypothetical protein
MWEMNAPPHVQYSWEQEDVVPVLQQQLLLSSPLFPVHNLKHQTQ